MTGVTGDVLVLFGVTGDLSRQMILPALYRLTERGELTVPVVGVSRSAGDPDEVRKLVTASVEETLDGELAGDPAYFARMDNVEEAWRVIGPALGTATEPLPYRAGTWGPSAADTMPGPQGWQTLPPVR